MGGGLTDRASPRVAGHTMGNLLLDLVRWDEFAAFGDMAVRAVGCLHLNPAVLERAEELPA